MSGKYENARLLLTPVDNLEKSELFFRNMYKLETSNWVLRDDNDIARNDFLSGTGLGWVDKNIETANKMEIQKFRQDAFNNQNIASLDADQQKRIREKVTAIRAEATAESRAWLKLYDTRFTFTLASRAILAEGTEAMIDSVVVTQVANSPIFGQLQQNGINIVGLELINTSDGSAVSDTPIFSWNIGKYFIRKSQMGKGGYLPLKFMLNKQNNTFNTYPFLLNI